MLKKLAQKFILFKKKDENSALISVGLFIMVMAIFLIKMGNRHLPENWKSEVEIWGTVSDWFIVIITLVTAVFLYKTLFAQNKTLDSQLKVQEEQNRLFKIEELKYLREIKPVVELQISKVPIYEEGLLTHLGLSINLTVSKAVDINHKVYTSNSFNLSDEGYGNLINKKFYLENLSESQAPPKFPTFLIEMKYKDCDGNEYLYKLTRLYISDKNNPFIFHLEFNNQSNITKSVY